MNDNNQNELVQITDLPNQKKKKKKKKHSFTFKMIATMIIILVLLVVAALVDLRETYRSMNIRPCIIIDESE